ncbi:hypothetical protein BBM38_23695 [Vibrio parahaemolyticus]|uniref:hypothetical protein n=1 Tax=Vibrio parahaemolyticus TaxID=670 RepID=UPI00084B49C4|nr:hypothetical protein [Vibrio parahaemolyticus]ODZ29299.1 hypothetical protein BBM38_23695 [Vibrio parahaemolyticus]ODZ38483.1 hypothetical protein BBM37_08190 [Vibrio parahaemolyticus]
MQIDITKIITEDFIKNHEEQPWTEELEGVLFLGFPKMQNAPKQWESGFLSKFKEICEGFTDDSEGYEILLQLINMKATVLHIDGIALTTCTVVYPKTFRHIAHQAIQPLLGHFHTGINIRYASDDEIYRC